MSDVRRALDATQRAVEAWHRCNKPIADEHVAALARVISAVWLAVVETDTDEIKRSGNRARDYLRKKRKQYQRRDDQGRVVVTDAGYMAWPLDPAEIDRGKRIRAVQRVVTRAITRGDDARHIAELLCANEVTEIFGRRSSRARHVIVAIDRALVRSAGASGAKGSEARAEKVIVAAVVASGIDRQEAVDLFARNSLLTRE